MFLAVQTQWRHAGMGQRTGLDYAGLQAVMGLYAVGDPREVFDQVRVLEQAVLQVDREKSEARTDAR